MKSLIKRKKIMSLPGSVADRIAAGEVVERPVSIVKELLENSIDSGADSITLEIRNGGKSYIRVTDNGCGIPKEDVETAFLRHATNKIFRDSDLFCIETLGFRGEALASIAAVTRTQMITKIPEADTGIKIVVEGGTVKEKSPVGAAGGTTIIVTDLFYNTPAREKFLKKDSTESGLIIDLMSKISLAYPDIKFRLINNGKPVFNTSGKGDILENIFVIYGKETAAGLILIDNESKGIRVKGYISNPLINKNNRRNQIFFVNGRTVMNRTIENAIAQGYGDKVPEGRFPSAFVFLEVDPGTVDVNVHPNKKEIRFGDPVEIREFIKNTVFEALNTKTGIGDISKKTILKSNPSVSESDGGNRRNKNIFTVDSFDKSEGIQEEISEFKRNGIRNEGTEKFSPIGDNREIIDERANGDRKDCLRERPTERPVKGLNGEPEKSLKAEFIKRSKGSSYGCDNGKTGLRITDTKPLMIDKTETGSSDENKKTETEVSGGNEVSAEASENAFDISSIDVLGTVFDTYIAAKDRDTFYLIDQHAAHERVFYEKFMKDFEKKEKSSQLLLTPLVKHFLYSEVNEDSEWIGFLMKCGFEIEPFGGQEFIVRGIPSYMDISEASLFLEDYAGSIDRDIDFKDRKTIDRIIMKSCKSAVKAHDRLSDAEIKALLKSLSETENPYSCPHGRPVIIKMSEGDMEKMFKRA